MALIAMLEPVKIYCLIDPNTLLIMYVGKSHTTLNERLRLHIAQAKRTKKPTRKEKWMLELLNQNQKPFIETLEEVSRNEWREKERFWIREGKKSGWPLLNLKRGGEGYDNLTHSEEFKEGLRKKMIGNKYNLGTKWSLEQRELMKVVRPEPWNKGTKGLCTKSDNFKKTMSQRMTGERHHQAKLSDNQASELKRRFIDGEKCVQLSKEYGISYSNAVKIANNKIRKTCVPL